MPNIVLSRMKTHPPPPPAPKKGANAKSGKKTWVDLKLRVKEDGEGRPRIEKFGQGLKESQVGKNIIFVGNMNYFMSFLVFERKGQAGFPAARGRRRLPAAIPGGGAADGRQVF